MKKFSKIVLDVACGHLDYKDIKANIDVLNMLLCLGIPVEESQVKSDEYVGHCPICGYDKKKSFCVNEEKKSFICFGICKKKGSLVDLVGYLILGLENRPEGQDLRECGAYVKLINESNGISSRSINDDLIIDEDSVEELEPSESTPSVVTETVGTDQEATAEAYDDIEASVTSHIRFDAKGIMDGQQVVVTMTFPTKANRERLKSRFASILENLQ